MHRVFGPIVAELRKGRFDVGTGKALTQQQLARQIGVSPRWIEALEQGRKSYLEAEMLVKLADALALTTLERREFFALAAGVLEHQFTFQRPPPATILAPLLVRQPQFADTLCETSGKWPQTGWHLQLGLGHFPEVGSKVRLSY